ncbi:MAG TPA: hypothetical protein VN025_04980 [Candidatus Dormibacteraeota bacterium]|jgi:tetratricopeptide (TPR) repeat protein|nr:hypothetical protein [Candidatus Dormibacteraeota bacterium]
MHHRHYSVLLALLSANISFACAAFAQHEHTPADGSQLGIIDFPVSCTALQPDFNHAVALLHSFWYKKAEESFAAIAKADPSCGMAEWGVAMSHYRQLWDPPTPADLQIGWAAVERAKATGTKTDRENAYINAMEIFYKDSATRPHAARALDYEKAMQKIFESYPQDHEAAIFYALAVRADAPITDKTYANQKKSSAILEKLFIEYPNHPGLAHYIIHCDDYPALAPLALDAARRYAKIAPDAPHALHMPSHIFTRLGLWQESISSNLASAAAAKKNDLAGDALHASDYLVYAYLQMGQDGDALAIAKALPKPQSGDAAYYTALYATAVIPARLVVERQQWPEAAALTLPAGIFPGGRYSSTEADLYFAQALGAARIGNLDAARNGLQQMASLRARLMQNNDNYSSNLVDIQTDAVTAWIAFCNGKTEEALRLMRAAAEHEDSTDKLPVTPGAIIPSRELLGDMLLEAKQPAAALEAFEASLQLAPERFHALYSAGHSAQLAGNQDKAKTYFTKLLANCQKADPSRTEVREAKLFLAQK